MAPKTANPTKVQRTAKQINTDLTLTLSEQMVKIIKTTAPQMLGATVYKLVWTTDFPKLPII